MNEMASMYSETPNAYYEEVRNNMFDEMKEEDNN
jgi:hypothetical protein